jgi:hypothetical protein
LAAACFGFVSAVFFAIGSAFLSQSKIASLSGTYYRFNSAIAASIVSQSTQYLIGAVLLFFAFLFQVVSALASPAIIQSTSPVLASVWLFVSSVLVAIGLPSWLICNYLTKWRLDRVLTELRSE